VPRPGAPPGRHRHGRAQRGLRDGQVDLRDQVVALSDEPRIGLDADEHVQVAGAPADLAGVPFAAEPDALPVVDPGRDLDRDRAFLDDPAVAAARPARNSENSR